MNDNCILCIRQTILLNNKEESEEKMGRPLISICIPVYNGEHYIEKAIKSVLDQSYNDFELVIIDNKSTDRTLDVINKFNDTRIKLYINKKNIGMVANWNKCLEKSKGEFIQFLCHDDYLDRLCLEKKINAFNYAKDICLVFNASYIINNEDTIIMKRKLNKADKLFDGTNFAHKSFLSRNLYGEPSNVMFKRNISEVIGGFDARLPYSPDWDYWLRLSKFGKVYYINDFLMYYRVSSSSATSSMLKVKDKLKQDDEQLIRNYKENSVFKLKLGDVLLHKTNIYLRMYLREIFMKVIN